MFQTLITCVAAHIFNQISSSDKEFWNYYRYLILLTLKTRRCGCLFQKYDCLHTLQMHGGLSLAGFQVPTKATLSLTLLSWTRQRIGRSFTIYHPRQKKTQFGEIILIY